MVSATHYEYKFCLTIEWQDTALEEKKIQLLSFLARLKSFPCNQPITIIHYDLGHHWFYD